MQLAFGLRYYSIWEKISNIRLVPDRDPGRKSNSKMIIIRYVIGMLGAGGFVYISILPGHE